MAISLHSRPSAEPIAHLHDPGIAQGEERAGKDGNQVGRA